MLNDIEMRVRTFASAGHSVTYFEVSDVDAAIERAIARGTVAPYGAVPWASAFLFAEKLSRMRLAGKTIVDVGAGCGVVSLMASKLGANVIALEIDELARQLLVQAARDQALEIDVRHFDVGSTIHLPEAELYIFADLLYEADLAHHVAHRCIEAIVHNGCIWVGDPKRTGRNVFREILVQAGYACDFAEMSYRAPDMERLQNVGVYVHSPVEWANVW